jgi:transposase
VGFTGGRWQCAFQVIVEGKTRPAHARRSQHPVVGVDVGVKDLLVVATPDGTEVAKVAAQTVDACAVPAAGRPTPSRAPVRSLRS